MLAPLIDCPTLRVDKPVAVASMVGAVGTVAAVTVTFFSAVVPLPSAAVARIVAGPALRPVTTPVCSSTVAILVLRLLHVMFLLVALSGTTVAVRVIVLLVSTDTSPSGRMVMPVTFIPADSGMVMFFSIS